MAVVGVVVGVAVSLVAVLIPWLPSSASEEMDRITFVYWFATVISIAIFALVMAVIVYSVRTFRAQPEDDTDGPPIHGHTGLEIVWTAVPALLVIAIGVVSAVVLAQNSDAGTNPLRIRVVAQQFAWRFEYPGDPEVRSGDLVLPVDRTVQLELRSLDVIHSFWVPDFGQKQDLVPGTEQELVITPTKTGTFPLVCTELCGLGHATMRATVQVRTQAEYEQWLAEQRSGGAGGGGAGDGEALFAELGCGGCHALEQAGTDAQVGPPLETDELRAAAEGAGQPLDGFVEQSIVDPDAVVAAGYQPGVMPGDYAERLSQEQLETLVGYLTGSEG
jgi:cytochrome c oxidase subunit 2